METSRSRDRGHARGFSLLEVIVAVAVLGVGMLSVAFLTANTLAGSNRAKYMSIASTLCSEKLEDLSRWPEIDPHVGVPTGQTTMGSLTSDVAQSVTIGSSTAFVNYYDEIILAAGDGAFSEAVSGVDGDGHTVYTTTSHSPDGTMAATTATTPPAAVATFKRRWLIESDSPIAGVRRITVRVILQSPGVRPPVLHSMSLVRP
jgi:prepilin-type N-terminal cleavage/methylation domain-containing protein